MSKLKRAKSQFIKLFQYDISNQNRINLLDVKALYDAAYDEKAKTRASVRKFKAKLKQARQLDVRYRAQIEADLAGLYMQKAV